MSTYLLNTYTPKRLWALKNASFIKYWIQKSVSFTLKNERKSEISDSLERRFNKQTTAQPTRHQTHQNPRSSSHLRKMSTSRERELETGPQGNFGGRAAAKKPLPRHKKEKTSRPVKKAPHARLAIAERGTESAERLAVASPPPGEWRCRGGQWRHGRSTPSRRAAATNGRARAVATAGVGRRRGAMLPLLGLVLFAYRCARRVYVGMFIPRGGLFGTHAHRSETSRCAGLQGGWCEDFIAGM